MILTHHELDVTLVDVTHPWSWERRVGNYAKGEKNVLGYAKTLWIPAEDDWLLGIYFPYTLVELLWGGCKYLFGCKYPLGDE